MPERTPSKKTTPRRASVSSSTSVLEVDSTRKALFRFNGGLTQVNFKAELVDIPVFKAAMLKTGMITPERFDELYLQIVANDLTSEYKKSLFLELVTGEVMLPSQKAYIDALNDPKRDLSSLIGVEEFGKRKVIQDTIHGYGIYRISDSFVAPGTEHQITFNFVQDYNKQRMKFKLPIYQPDLPNPFPPMDSKDKQFFYGEPFRVQGFQMTEKTVFKAMAKFGFRDWETSTGNKLLFCFRKGDIFVLTTGRAVDVIHPYMDTNFVPKVECWIKAQPRNSIHNSAIFHNRYKSYDILITLSMLALVIKDKEFEVKYTGNTLIR